MQTFPVISDMALFQPNTATGKLKAVMIPTRPNGFHCSMRAWPGPEGYKYSLSEHKFIKNNILNPSSSGQKYRYQTREDSWCFWGSPHVAKGYEHIYHLIENWTVYYYTTSSTLMVFIIPRTSGATEVRALWVPFGRQGHVRFPQEMWTPRVRYKQGTEHVILRSMFFMSALDLSDFKTRNFVV